MLLLKNIINRIIFSLVLLLAISSLSQAQIRTVVGNGNRAFAGDGGLAANASLNSPHEIAVDSQGNLYIADTLNYAVRKVNIQTGVITTLIGTGQFGELHADQPAQGQSMGEIYGVAVDNNGQVFFGDASFGIIFKIDNNGVLRLVVDIIHTFSSTEVFLTGMVFDQSKRFLYVADAGLNTILKIDTTNNSISVVAGTPNSSGFSGDGGQATAAMLNFPMDVDIDTQGNLFVADSENNRIRKINTQGIITTIAGNGDTTFNGDNIPATTATLDFPQAVAVDSSGNLLISDSFHYVIRKIDTTGSIITFAGSVNSPGFSGDGGSPLNAQFGDAFNFGLGGIVINGNITYITDEGNHRIRTISSFCPISSITPLTQSPKILSVEIVTNLNAAPYAELQNSSQTDELRVFPDAVISNPSNSRQQIRVKISTTGSNLPVYLRIFDVDDSGNLFTQDDNIPGQDNQGIPKSGDFGVSNLNGFNPQITETSVMTDDCGNATSEFIVSLQPGDNYKLVASMTQSFVKNATISGQAILNPTTQQPFPTEKSPDQTSGSDGVTSKLLTVWRKLHIEVDDMGIVTGNDEGGANVVVTKKQNSRITINKQLADDIDRFENGRVKLSATTAEYELAGQATNEGTASLNANEINITITIKRNDKAEKIMNDLAKEAQNRGAILNQKKERMVISSVNGRIPNSAQLTIANVAGITVMKGQIFSRSADSFDIKGNDAAINSQIELKSDSGRQKDSFNGDLDFVGFICTSIVDDDDFNGNDKGNLRGDMGEDLTGLDQSLVMDSYAPLQNAFAKAFIKPTYDLSGNSSVVPFRVNLQTPFPDISNDMNLRSVFQFDNVATESNRFFWTVYLLGTYQDIHSGSISGIGFVGDVDPDSENNLNTLRGRADRSFPFAMGVVISIESVRETEDPVHFITKAATVAHELGHTLGGDHSDKGLMGIGSNRTSLEFSNVTLRKFRRALHP